MITDDQLDELLAAADPAPAHRIAALPLGPARDALRGAIAAEADGSRALRGLRGRRPGTRRRRVLIAGLAGAALLALGGTALRLPFGGDDGRAWSATERAFADRSPRLLATEPGWTVIRASEWDETSGEVELANGDERLQLTWYRGQPDAASKDPQVGTVEVGDATATITGDGEPPATARRFFATFRSGDWLVVADGSAMALDRYREVVGGLRHADVDAWLDAMPPTIVRPAGRASAVAAMLEGVPLPDGFDVEALRRSEGLVLGRYDLGARVSGAVACAWIERWAAAKARGDELAARRASTALGTSHGWPILQEMDAAGDYPEVLWQLADAVAGPGTVEGGKTVAVQDAYVEALGCDAG